MKNETQQLYPAIRFLPHLVFVLGLIGCGESESLITATLDERSKLAFNNCVVSIADPQAICGTLTVAENRDKKDSRTIGLPFVIVPAKSLKPDAEPVLLFTGGPGPSPLRTIEGISAEDIGNYPLRQNRDLIVLTHRGTDLTINGNLDCPEVLLNFAAGERYANVAEAINNSEKCKARLQSTFSGIEFEQYNTVNIARDHEDLLLLLGKQRGFKTWNILGSSYGSLLAQQYVRDYPTSVRSVVYDGPLPIQDNTFLKPDVLEATTQILEACKANVECNNAYPNLLQTFAQAIERLEAKPVLVDDTLVYGRNVLNALRRELPPIITPYSKVPFFMDLVIKNDLKGANEVFAFVGFPEIVITPDTAFFTISCSDSAGQSAKLTDIPDGAANWPLRVRQIASYYQNFPAADICPTWVSSKAVVKTDKSPRTNNLPSLITVGQFDTATPSVNADSLLKSLSNGQKVVFTGRGHSLAEGEPCMLTIAAAFFDNPMIKLDTSCVDSQNTLRFDLPIGTDIKTVLNQVRGQAPGIAAALVTDSSIVVTVDGVGSSAFATPLNSDNWMALASNGKSITAMAIGVQIEKGTLKWTDTLSYLFPELADTMLAQYRNRTLKDVLTFRAGLLPMLSFSDFDQVPITSTDLSGQRMEFSRWLLSQVPINDPGSSTEYSNASYVLAGAILERASGKSFELTVLETVLTPLGLRGIYGLPQNVSVQEPAAHLKINASTYEPIPVNAPFVLAVPKFTNPAGLLSMPIADYGRYAQIHLRALQGKPTLLKAETFSILYTPIDPLNGLAMGWVVSLQEGKKIYEFTGSIDVMNAYIKLIPSDNRGAIVLTNYDMQDTLDSVFTKVSDALLKI
jgi:D-alanyl-D-alanine carboxypeptidase